MEITRWQHCLKPCGKAPGSMPHNATGSKTLALGSPVVVNVAKHMIWRLFSDLGEGYQVPNWQCSLFRVVIVIKDGCGVVGPNQSDVNHSGRPAPLANEKRVVWLSVENIAAVIHGEWLRSLAERLGSGDGEGWTLLTRQIAFEPLPESVLFAFGLTVVGLMAG